jgi:DNA polymerase-3 subunit delta
MDAFGLTQALRRKQTKASFTALQHLLDNKEDPIPLLGLLASQYRMMFRIKLLSKKGMGQQAMAKKLGASPYYVRKLAEVAANFSEEELKKDLYALLGCDLSLKSGGVASVELPLLISELLNA